jgi:hypothetical protein
MSKLLTSRLALLLFMPVALFGLDACRTAGIKDAYMTSDSAGRMKTDEFKVKDMEIHCIVEFVSGREDATLKAKLVVPNGSKAKVVTGVFAPGKGSSVNDISLTIKIASTDPTDTSGGSDSTTGPWDRGIYHFDLYVDDEYDRSLPFEVCTYEGDDCTSDADCCGVATRGSKCINKVCVEPH